MTRLYTFLLLASLFAIYATSQFLRNSTGVIIPELTQAFSLRPDQLGVLSGAFFLSFALAQLPLGVMLDRYGPRNSMTVCVVFAIAGSLMFAVGDSLNDLTAGRLLMGLGCSSFFMGPLMIISRWFEPAKFAFLSGLLLGFGNMGTFLATAPMALLVVHQGWRSAFYYAAGFILIAGFAVNRVARDAPENHAFHQREREPISAGFKGFGAVFKSADFWPVFVIHFVLYPVTVSTMALWGPKYFADIYGLSLSQRGGLMSILTITLILGFFIWGASDRWFNRRKVLVMAGAIVMSLILLILAYRPALPYTITVALFVLFSMAAAVTPIMIAHGRALFGDKILGRGLTVMNTANMGGVFVLQAISGLLVYRAVEGASAERLPLEAYSICFGFMGAVMLVGTAIYSFSNDRRPLD